MATKRIHSHLDLQGNNLLNVGNWPDGLAVRDWAAGVQKRGWIVRYNGQLYEVITDRADSQTPPGPTTTATYRPFESDPITQNTASFYTPSTAAQAFYGAGPLTLKQALDMLGLAALTAPAPSNVAPTSSAGPDKAITLPTNSTTLAGAGTDADGTITAYNWTQVSGPNTATIANPATASTTASNMVQGVYVFRLTITDNSGATASDDVQITVNAAPAGPGAQVSNASAVGYSPSEIKVTFTTPA